MSFFYIIFYFKNIIIMLSMIDIFRFIFCKCLKFVIFYVYGFYFNFVFFLFLYICVLYFNIIFGFCGLLKGKKILLIEIIYNLIY